MKNKLIHVFTGVVLAGLTFNAQAADFNYNYIEGAYESYDLDGTDVEADAGRISGSYELNPNLNIIGEYAKGDLENSAGGSDLNFEESAIGIEYHTSIAPKTDLTSNIKYINQDVDTVGDDDGYGIGVGVRHWLMDKVEVGANVDYIDIDDNDDTRLKVGARYHFNESISAGAGYSTSDEKEDVVSGNIRWSF